MECNQLLIGATLSVAAKFEPSALTTLTSTYNCVCDGSKYSLPPAVTKNSIGAFSVTVETGL